MTNLKKNANLVEALGSSLRSGDHGLKAVPGLVKRVLAEGAWRSFVTQRGELVEYDHFEEFVTTPPLKGLGASLVLVKTIIRDDPVALDLLDQATQKGSGPPESLDNIQGLAAPTGTSREAGLRRLRKDRPDLHSEVLAGTLTTHAAMVKAGFRRRMVNIPVHEPEAAAKALRRNLPPEAVAELARLLVTET